MAQLPPSWRATSLGDVERVGARRLEDGEAGGRLAVEVEELAVGLRAELDAADVAHARHVAVGAGLDDDVAELLGIVEAADTSTVYWNDWSVRRRRRADLAGGDLLALLLQRLDHVLRRQAARLQLLGVEPDPHRVLPGAEHVDVADAGSRASSSFSRSVA